MESETLNINITGGIQVLYDEYQKQVDTKAEANITSLELYIECREYQDKSNLPPKIFFSDLLLLILQNNPSIKKIRVEGYERFCYSKQYMRSELPEFGLFYKFTDFIEEYEKSGKTQPYFENLEEFDLHKCNLNENDLQVLGASLFPNLKKIHCYWCAPHSHELRDKYRDFIPIEWEDDDDVEDAPNVKTCEFYSGQEDNRDYYNGASDGHHLA